MLQRQVSKQLPELVVADDEQGVYSGPHFFESFSCLVGPAASFKIERHGDNTNGEDVEVLARLGDDGRSARSCAASHSGGHKNHGGVFAQLLEHIIEVFDGGIFADFRDAPGALSGGQGCAQLDADGDIGSFQCLVVRIADNEVHALDALLVHVVDGI